LIRYSFSSFIFFFQAEDGIRDFHVTGVQTCALPISEMDFMSTRNLTREEIGVVYGTAEMMASLASANRASAAEVRKSFWLDTIRSEERRVGKEGRSEGWTSE